jgi:hypothetical protein
MKVRGMWLVAAVLAVATVPSACGGTPRADLPYQADFSRADCGWSTQDDDGVTLGCADGGYRVLVKDNDSWYSSHLRLDRPVKGLRVEADATVRKRGGVYGVSCWGEDERERYVFMITPLQQYVIRREIGEGSAVNLEGGDDRRLSRGNSTKRIRADCVTGGGTTVLTLYVDGTKIAQTTDPSGIQAFAAAGVEVNEAPDGAEFVFDDFAVRELSTAELARMRKEARAWGESVCGAYGAWRSQLETSISSAESVMYPSHDPGVRRKALVRFYAEAVQQAKQLLAVAKRSGGAQIADRARATLVAEFERIVQGFEAGKRGARLLPIGSEERFNPPWLALLDRSDRQASEQALKLVEISASNEGTLGDAFIAGSACEPIGEIFGDY